MKKLSADTKHKLQLVFIYLLAIVFCILWLSNKIAINNRIKQDEMSALEYAGKAANSLELYAQNGNLEMWNESIENVGHFSAIYWNVICDRQFHKKLSRISATEAEMSVDIDVRTLYRLMISDPEAVKPYAADLSWAMRQFGDRDPFSDKNTKYIAEKLSEILTAIKPE